MHELYYLVHGWRRTPYCACGWVGPKCADSPHAFENKQAAQDYFVDHLRGLSQEDIRG